MADPMDEPDYADAAALDDYLELNNAGNTEQLELAATVASRWIERYCDEGSFGVPNDAAAGTTTRVYRPTTPCRLTLDRGVIVDGQLVVKVDTTLDGTYDTTYTRGTEFELDNVNDLDTEPAREIILLSGYRFPTTAGARAVIEVTGRFGWPVTPDIVKRACLLQASRLYRRAMSPEGIVNGFDQALRVGHRLDPDVQLLLDPVRWSPVKV